MGSDSQWYIVSSMPCGRALSQDVSEVRERSLLKNDDIDMLRLDDILYRNIQEHYNVLASGINESM